MVATLSYEAREQEKRNRTIRKRMMQRKTKIMQRMHRTRTMQRKKSLLDYEQQVQQADATRCGGLGQVALLRIDQARLPRSHLKAAERWFHRDLRA